MEKENIKRDKLYLFRCGKRLSQQSMADEIGVDRMTYAKIENGKIGISRRFLDKFKAAFSLDDNYARELLHIDTE